MICGSNSIKLFSLVGDFMAQPSEQCSRWHSHRRAGYNYPLWDEVADYSDKAYLYKVLDKNTTMRNSQIALDNFYDTKTPQNVGKLRQNEDLLTLLADSAINADTIALDSIFVIVNTKNASIINNGKEYENADKWIMSIIAKLAETGISSLTENEILNIQLLASSCPAMMGNSVYKARSVDALLHPGVQYYDYDLCASVLPQNKTGATNLYNAEEEFLNSDSEKLQAQLITISKINSFELYPNPIKRNCDITLTYNIDEASSLAIYDMVGKLILDLDLNIKAQHVSFNIGNIVAGTYKIKIATKNRTLKSFKLNVQ
jgi:Secretion system C-terminal sorting domain